MGGCIQVRWSAYHYSIFILFFFLFSLCRVAQNNGGPHAAKQAAFLWAKTLGGESAVKLLSKFGILEAGIDYACESYQFEFAFELAKTAMARKKEKIIIQAYFTSRYCL